MFSFIQTKLRFIWSILPVPVQDILRASTILLIFRINQEVIIAFEGRGGFYNFLSQLTIPNLLSKLIGSLSILFVGLIVLAWKKEEIKQKMNSDDENEYKFAVNKSLEYMYSYLIVLIVTYLLSMTNFLIFEQLMDSLIGLNYSLAIIVILYYFKTDVGLDYDSLRNIIDSLGDKVLIQ